MKILSNNNNTPSHLSHTTTPFPHSKTDYTTTLRSPMTSTNARSFTSSPRMVKSKCLLNMSK